MRRGKATSVRADHQRQQEIAHRGGDRRHQEEPHHDDAVQREQAIIFVGRQEQPGRADQLEPHQRDGDAADEEEHGDRQRIEDGDALVIGGRRATTSECGPRRGSFALPLSSGGTKGSVVSVMADAPSRSRLVVSDFK